MRDELTRGERDAIVDALDGAWPSRAPSARFTDRVMARLDRPHLRAVPMARPGSRRALLLVAMVAAAAIAVLPFVGRRSEPRAGTAYARSLDLGVEEE